MLKPVLFNHIPKTGGTTLRIILNRVYSPERLFFIRSKDIASSLEEYKRLPPEHKNFYHVLAGIGADMFVKYMPKEPFRICILREPLSLFISQFYYLKVSPNSNFIQDVSRMESLEEYMDYALKTGQDNLLTRHLSESMEFLVNPEVAIPNMETEGKILLEKALKNMAAYGALINLSNFDEGVFALSRKLQWPYIPVYRPSNRNLKNKPKREISREMEEKLRHFLRFDIELYKYFLENKMEISSNLNKNNPALHLFKLRQFGIRKAANYLRKD